MEYTDYLIEAIGLVWNLLSVLGTVLLKHLRKT